MAARPNGIRARAMRVCALAYADTVRKFLDEEKPGWTQEQFWCPWHRENHELTRDPGQLRLLGAQGADNRSYRSSRPRFRLLSGGQPCFHGSKSDVLTAPCVYCGATMHSHKDDLGRVKSGRHSVGFLKEPCPACHRVNAVLPAYGLGGIRTAKIIEGKPAMQLKLG